jgi:parallel beta-helix repeat protein
MGILGESNSRFNLNVGSLYGSLLFANTMKMLGTMDEKLNKSLTFSIVPIGLLHSSGNSISNNNCSDNYYGIQLSGSYLRGSNNNSITNNTCMNNNWGISISSHSSYNTIYHNSLRNNTNQAFDNTGTSYWNGSYPSGGNYWSDYRQKYIEEYNKDPEDKQCGVDQDLPGDGDGIWDTPYAWIGGGTGAKDRYPLVRPLWNVG